MHKTLSKSIFTLTLITASSLSQANDNFYLGVGYGQATNDACDVMTIYCDDNSTAWKGLAGYNFHKNFGVEFSYNNIGKAHAYHEASNYNATLDGDAFAISAVGRIDLTESLNLFGKIGAANWKADAHLRQNNTRIDYEDDGTDITYGAGITWTFDNNYHLGLEWQRYEIEFDNFSNAFGKEGDAETISVLYTVSF